MSLATQDRFVRLQLQFTGELAGFRPASEADFMKIKNPVDNDNTAISQTKDDCKSGRHKLF
jgi:hypothetical protein